MRYICTRFHYVLSLDNDVLEMSKRRAMFYNILSQNFIVKYKNYYHIYQYFLQALVPAPTFTLKFLGGNHNYKFNKNEQKNS